MLSKFLTGILLPALFFSCSAHRDKKQLEDQVPAKTPETIPSQACYRYTTTTDTILLTVTRKGEAVTGTLLYHLNGKDRNTGTLKGLVKNDILVANYSFLSEGIRSVRQVAFKFTGTTAVEGFEESAGSNDTAAYFRDINSLNYTHSMVLTASACE